MITNRSKVYSTLVFASLLIAGIAMVRHVYARVPFCTLIPADCIETACAPVVPHADQDMCNGMGGVRGDVFCESCVEMSIAGAPSTATLTRLVKSWTICVNHNTNTTYTSERCGVIKASFLNDCADGCSTITEPCSGTAANGLCIQQQGH